MGLKIARDGMHEVFIKVGNSHFAIRKITFLHELRILYLHYLEYKVG